MDENALKRRDALRICAGVALATSANAAMATAAIIPARARKPLYAISLAQWSIHQQLFDGEIDNLDFAPLARERFDIDAVEYASRFCEDKVNDEPYLAQMKKRADDAGVKSLLIMIDGQGRLGDPNPKALDTTIDNHTRWLHAASALCCHSIRVNAQSEGTRDEQAERCVEGLRRLTEIAEPLGLNIIVENHGGLSSDGTWLACVIRRVDHPNCGTLPDFGNFFYDWNTKDDPTKWFDRYEGVRLLMPFAKAVSAKSHDFDEAGNEIHTDYHRMMKIVVDAGYRGYVGIEYEGKKLPAFEGIHATKRLLVRVRDKLEQEHG